jgi:hypothetical protein
MSKLFEIWELNIIKIAEYPKPHKVDGLMEGGEEMFIKEPSMDDWEEALESLKETVL